MSSFSLTPDAEADLIEIWKYGASQWSEGQADRYLDHLEECCSTLNQSGHLWKPITRLDESLFAVHCEKHFIFFICTDQQSKPVIIAFLHERMDLLNQIRKRLDP